MTISQDNLARAALEAIERAFAHRRPPSIMTDSKQLSDSEYEEVMSFEGLGWQDVSFDLVERCSDAVFWFSPEAFCFYLPGLLAAGLRERRVDANAYDSLIGMLDRSPNPDYWDDFFLPRWTLLTAEEVNVVGAWIQWLQSIEPEAFHPNTYERALETLDLLKDRVTR
jgi:hypothetical protein